MILRLVLALFLVLAVLLVGCKQAEVADTDTVKGEIVIGILEDLSGPLAGTMRPQVDGNLDAWRYINEEKDGILGHSVRPVVVDFRMDAALAISGWERVRDEGALIVQSGSASIAPFLTNSAEDDHIPILAGQGSIEQMFPQEPSFVFGTVPMLYSLFDAACSEIENDWAKRGQDDSPRIAFDIVSFGNYQKIESKCGTIVAEKRGWEYLITATSIGPPDVTTQVFQMKKFGCDYVFLMGTDAAVILFIKEFDRQNFHPKIYGSLALGDPEVWSATGQLAAGATFFQHGPQWTDIDLQGIQFLHELNANWHPEVEIRPGLYPRGFSHAMAVAEAIKRAIEKTSIENVDGAAVREAMETFRDYDPMGWNAPYTWTPTDHQGTRGLVWYRWAEDGTMVRVSDWYAFDPLPEEMRTTAWWLKD